MINKKKERFIKEVDSLIKKLLTNTNTYFDKDLFLNSEGMKLFSRLARILIYIYPEIKYFISKVRENPSYETLVKLVTKIKEIEGID